MDSLSEQVSTLVEQGRIGEARRLLAGILQQDPKNAQAWAMMADLVDNPQYEAECLRRVTRITDDAHLQEWAAARLARLEFPAASEQSSAETPEALHQGASQASIADSNRRRETLLPVILSAVLLVVTLAFLVMGGYRWIPTINPPIATKLSLQPPNTPTINRLAATSVPTDIFTPVITLTPTATYTPTMTPVPPELPVVLPPYLPAQSLITYVQLDGLPPERYFRQFGANVIIDGDTMAVSVPQDETIHMYARTRDSNAVPGQWVRKAILEPPKMSDAVLVATSGLSFDSCLALEGDLLAVCAHAWDKENSNSGAVDIYERVKGTWTWQTRLKSQPGMTREAFGSQVQFHNGLLYVGAPGISDSGSPSPGTVYIMERDGALWNTREKLVPPTGGISNFGTKIGLDGNTLVISAQQDTGTQSDDGTQDEPQPDIVYVYQQENGQWVQRVMLKEPDEDPTRIFGASLAIEGKYVVIGAVGALDDSRSRLGPGCVWIFEDTSPNRNWHAYNHTHIDEPFIDEAHRVLGFGTPIVLKNGVLLVGARYLPGVYLYRQNGHGDWEQKTVLQSSAPTVSYFGVSIAVDEQTVLVGAPGDGEFAAVYFFDMPLLVSSRVQLGAQPGQLDPTFGKNGLVTIHANDGYEPASAQVLTRPDGMTLLGGALTAFRLEDYLVLNLFKSDGSVEREFGTGSTPGYTLTRDPVLGRIAMLADGKIMLVANGEGSLERSGSEDRTEILLARLNTDGSVDSEYGQEGLTYFSLGPELNQVVDLAVQPDGGVVIAGTFGTLKNSKVARFTPEGNLDLAFGRSGLIEPVFNSSYIDVFSASDLAIQPDSKILVLGKRTLLALDKPRREITILLRFNPNGMPDYTFSGDGMVEMPDMLSGNSLLALPNGLILIGGTWDTEHMGMMRLTPEGPIDPSFGTEGILIPEFPLNSDLQTLIPLPDGKMVGLGSLGGNQAVFRFNPDGSLDRGFNGGYWQGAFGLTGSISGLGVLPDGNIMLAGQVWNGYSEEGYLFLARILGG